MPKADVGSPDLYMNFATFAGRLDGADSSTLVEVVVNTGLHVRGALIWLVHLVEAHLQLQSSSMEIYCALSTRQGLLVMPVLGDKGLVALFTRRIVSNGINFLASVDSPTRQGFLPPVPLATPALSLYLATGSDVAAMRDASIEARIGFTTAQLDAKAYIEISETWGWQ